MTEIEFRALAARGFNRIPLLVECLADLDTPLSLYLKLTDEGARANSLLLESVVGGERFGRYSFIGLPARRAIRSTGDRIEVLDNGKVVESATGDPIEFVREFRQRYRAAVPPGMPRFCGGLAGYFGYDMVRFIEPRLGPCTKPDPIGTPDMLFLLVDELAIVDNLRGRIYLIVFADPATPEAYVTASRRLRELRARLGRAVPQPPDTPVGEVTEVIREFARDDYLAAVARAKEYIVAGDMMQVQVGQCLRKPFTHSPLWLYRALRSINPSPYMYYYDFGDFHVVGASPETWCARSRSRWATRPMPASPRQSKHAATRPSASPFVRSRGPASAACRPSRTRHWPTNCSPTRRSAPSI